MAVPDAVLPASTAATMTASDACAYASIMSCMIMASAAGFDPSSAWRLTTVSAP